MFVATFLVLGVIHYRRGEIAWHGPLEIAKLVLINTMIALVGGAAIAGIGAIFDWLGWGIEKEREPYPLWLRGAVIALLVFGALYLMFRPNP
jgi:hypothetical protein